MQKQPLWHAAIYHRKSFALTMEVYGASLLEGSKAVIKKEEE